GDEACLARWAAEQAHLTHNHPMSDAACVTVGRMVHQALCGGAVAALQTLAGELVRDYPEFRYRPYLGNSSAYVVDTLQTVFHHFFSTGTFADCLIGVVNQGGDADTTGAIAGMIAGAFYGIDGIPRRWLKRLDPKVRTEITELADYLVNAAPLVVQGRIRPAPAP
uniref:ADP-ribosylglycohydrolase family protein n=1 Tax=Desulfosarcina cetonica TaxID=90730 RepID=UPI00155D8CA8